MPITRQSTLFTRTTKEVPAQESSLNAQLLLRAGFVHKVMAGSYAYLPLGLKVVNKIASIVREEMHALGAMEVLATALQPRTTWDKTGRWSDEVMYHLQDAHGGETGLGFSHEEAMVELVKPHIQSYKSLPFAIYQIQTKFRNEARAKSGILRGREFLMKDLYSFHTSTSDMDAYYDKVLDAYLNVFQRVGFETVYLTQADGGSMSDEPSHEFQVPTDAGEDTILACDACTQAYNEEIWDAQGVSEGQSCPHCSTGSLTARKASEVGNIFKQFTKYSEPMQFSVTLEDGSDQAVIMAAYGIGISRVMGVLVETHHDERGIIWPAQVAPFDVHVIAIGDDPEVQQATQKLLDQLVSEGKDVLFDDRGVRPGEAFADADMIGIPERVVIGTQSLQRGGAEHSVRSNAGATTIRPIS